jgi:hypothetical protein
MTALRAAWGRAPLEDRLWLVTLVVAVLWCLIVLDPFGPATIDPDASASVLYFQRIVGGQRLETFVPTTPKPLLTLVYGVAWAVSGDWREVVWQTIGVFGVAAASAALLAFRLASRLGGIVAGGAAAAVALAALAASSAVLLEVSRANSLVWALAWWLIAGLAITSTPARPRLAGAALLFAGLCRFETLALSAVALVAIAAWWWRGRVVTVVPGFAEPPERTAGRADEVRRATTRRIAVAGILAVGWLPIALLHDWLLTGNPLYWLSVPAGYTAIYNADLAPIDAVTYAGTFLGRLAPEWPLIVLAALGVAALARGRQWLSLTSFGAIALGVTGLLFWLAMRGTYISNRYHEPIDLALTLLSAVGVGWVAGLVAARQPGRSAAVHAPAAVLLGGVLGVAVVWPALPWDRRATT